MSGPPRLAATVAFCLLVAACATASDPTPAADLAVDVHPPDTSPESAETGGSGTSDAAPLAGGEWVVGEWEEVPGSDECGCADGSDFAFSIREADPTRVVFFLEGGGACFSAETCAFQGGSYTSSIPATAPADRGIFAADEDRNPVADWSFVYVPYCTGDIHLGTRSADYGDDLRVQHFGGINATTALDTLVDRFPDADQVLVAGASAGAASAPLFGGLAADRLPHADIAVLADSAGAYASDPVRNGVLSELWGSRRMVPAWDSAVGLTAADVGIPDLYRLAGTEHPDIVFGRFDYAADAVQAFFIGLAGLGTSGLVTQIDQNETDIEAAGVNVASYVASGLDHTVLGRDTMYVQSVGGTSLVSWIERLVAFVAPADVHCADCGNAPA